MNVPEPQSRRYWRLNSLMVLRETREHEREAIDPEHFASIKANNAELTTLKSQERAVKARYARLKQRTASP